MKKLILVTAIFCLYFQAIVVSAATPDYSGAWALDVGKSTLPETVKIESMTLKVSQTAKELKVETEAKRTADAMRGGVRRSGDVWQTAIYNLDGTETKLETGSGMAAGSEMRKAKVMPDGKLSLTFDRSFKTEMGEMTVKTNETWELLDSGKTLKIIRYTESARGGTTWEMYFTKQSSDGSAAPTVAGNTETVGGENTPNLKSIQGGVLNGKAVSLPAPAYPAAARAVKAGGAVNVQVTIDEAGTVVSASAVSGHPLLRQAAEQAARQATFSPTTLSGQPVKITGVIVYNFVP